MTRFSTSFWTVGAQTLRQLLGPDAYRRAPLPGRTWALPYTEIADRPRFGWRGLLLDDGQYRRALPELRRLSADDPGNAQFRYDIALCLEQLGETAEALA
ncbi:MULTISPECIES: tetratricopeptide repeat protein, partial [Streptomyces]